MKLMADNLRLNAYIFGQVYFVNFLSKYPQLYIEGILVIYRAC